MNTHLYPGRYSHGTSLKIIGVRKRMLITASGLSIAIATESPPLLIAVLVSMSALIVWGSRAPWKTYVKALVAIGGFAIPAAVVIAYTSSAHVFSVAGLEHASILLLRGVAGTSCLLFLSFSTPMAELFEEAHNLGAPALFVELSLLTYRYIFLVLEEAKTMQCSQELRMGYKGYWKSLSSLGLLISNLFVRSLIRGERIHQAMDVRGYRGLYPDAIKEKEGDH